MSKSKMNRPKRGTVTRKDFYDDRQTSPANVSSSGSDTDSASVSSLSSEDSVTKMMARTQIDDSDDDYEMRNNNNYRCDPQYDYRKSYSMPWKTQLQVSNSGRLREKKKSRSPRHSAVLDNEMFTPLEQNVRNKEHRSVRFAV